MQEAGETRGKTSPQHRLNWAQGAAERCTVYMRWSRDAASGTVPWTAQSLGRSLLLLALSLALTVLADPGTQRVANEQGPGLRDGGIPRPEVLDGGIPKILHQNFLEGLKSAAEKELKQGLFRMDWMRSVKAFHPDWQYMFWDEAACLRLLEDKYPWFLPYYRKMDRIVVRSDVMRVFILHAYGGVYMDMDTEVYSNTDSSINAHILVLPEEERAIVNNAQMASVPGHPFWGLMMQHAVNKVVQVTSRDRYKWAQTHEERVGAWTGADLLNTTGPWALTAFLKKYLVSLGYKRPDRRFYGTYVDNQWQTGNATTPHKQSSTPSTILVQKKGSWFSACSWNDRKCQAMMTRCSPVLRGMYLCKWHDKHWSHAAWDRCIPDQPTKPPRLWRLCDAVRRGADKAQLPGYMRSCMERFADIVGQHHFSGSWTGYETAAREKHRAISRDMFAFFNHSDSFLEAPAFCTQPPGPGFRPTKHHEPSQLWTAWLDHALSPLVAAPSNTRQIGSRPGQRGKRGAGAGRAGAWEQAAAQRATHRRKRKKRLRTGVPWADKEPVCQWVSVFQTECVQKSSTCCLSKAELAARIEQISELAFRSQESNCRLTILTNMDVTVLTKQLWTLGVVTAVKIRFVHAPLKVVGASMDGSIGLTPLIREALSQRTDGTQKRFDLLHVSTPGRCGWKALDIMNREIESAFDEAQPTLLLLQLGSLDSNQGAIVYSAYQALMQSRDYLGHAHFKHRSRHKSQRGGVTKSVAQPSSFSTQNGTCPVCEKERGAHRGGVAELWLGLVRRAQLLRNLQQSQVRSSA